ncbi:MAG: guanylate kinase [Clostridiales bacterium]|nr:guanylate kinase [Clostridiales bacterium]
MNSNNGMLVVFSAPSGCGKDTVFHELLKRRDDVVESISATTRPPRNGELDGVDYYFLSVDEFEQMISDGGLLEYASYNGNYYGTPIKGVEKAVESGKICFLIIEVQGAHKVMKKYPDCVSIFLVPPSMEVLRHRLYKRNKDSDEVISRRLDIAKEELNYQDRYTYKIINDNIDDCVNFINKILNDELKKRKAGEV